MPRGPAPSWRSRKPPILDSYIQASVQQAGGRHDEAGRYALLHITGLADRDEAAEHVRALHRSARYLGYSVTAKPVRAGNGYRVEFSVIDKTHARKYVLAKYGSDRSKWPYDPRRRNGA